MLVPLAPLSRKPTLAEWLGPLSVPGDWWHGLDICIAFLEGAGGDNIMEFCRMRPGTARAEGGWTQGKLGPSYNCATQGDQVEWAATTDYAFASSDPEFTILVALKYLGTVGDHGYFNFRTSFSSGIWQLFGNAGAAQSTGWGWHSGALNTVSWNNTLPAVGDEVVYVITRLAGGTYELWKDGVSQGTTSNATGYASASEQLLIGGLDAGTDGDNALGEYHCAYRWDRVLSPDEIVYASSIDHFAPIRSYVEIPVGEAAAAGGLSIPVAMYNYRRRRVALVS